MRNGLSFYQATYCKQGRIKWTRGHGQSRDREAPKTLSATVAFQHALVSTLQKHL